MYCRVETSEIVRRIEHIRVLLRQRKPRTPHEHSLYEKREQRLKDLISNLRRTNGRAMVQMLYDLEELCCLTRDATYELFGYSLDAVRDYDLLLNHDRTHILESYVYERDFPVDLPLHLAPKGSFGGHQWLDEMVLGWQSDLPIRVLDRPSWRQPGMFYVQVGTEDSLGSELPPGAIALVEKVSEAEKRRPNPQSIYLLQFRNGYQCNRCVATRDRLHLIVKRDTYSGPQEFLFPGPIVRIVGVSVASRYRFRCREAFLYEPLKATTATLRWSCRGNTCTGGNCLPQSTGASSAPMRDKKLFRRYYRHSSARM